MCQNSVYATLSVFSILVLTVLFPSQHLFLNAISYWFDAVNFFALISDSGEVIIYLLVCGLEKGKGKPHFPTFLRPFSLAMRELYYKCKGISF